MSVPFEWTENIDQPSRRTRRAGTVPQSITCRSTVKPASFMFCTGTIDAVWLIDPATSMAITVSPR